MPLYVNPFHTLSSIYIYDVLFNLQPGFDQQCGLASYITLTAKNGFNNWQYTPYHLC